MADTLLGILEKTTDARECMAAQKQLEQAAQANLPNFLVELSRGMYRLSHKFSLSMVAGWGGVLPIPGRNLPIPGGNS